MIMSMVIILIIIKQLLKYIRPCQIDFLFSVTCAHAKKPGAVNLFFKKLARLSFLLKVKKGILFIYFNSNHFLFD